MESLGQRVDACLMYVYETVNYSPKWGTYLVWRFLITVCASLPACSNTVDCFPLCLLRLSAEERLYLFIPPYVHTLCNAIFVVPSIKRGRLFPTP